MLKSIVFSLFLLFSIGVSLAKEIKISSGKEQTTLIELFTSQGCSSCPPADLWLNKFVDDKDLWKGIVPVAFHVDYWNYLGWKDPYSSDKFTARQYNYKYNKNLQSVYTPAILVNGQEYRRNYIPVKNKDAGILQAIIANNNVKVEYDLVSDSKLELQFVLLGFGIETKITTGENANRLLPQEFVVLHHQTYQLKKGKVVFQLPQINPKSLERYAVAFWVNKYKSLTPLQATGSWL